jgi:hypothetical protein
MLHIGRFREVVIPEPLHVCSRKETRIVVFSGIGVVGIVSDRIWEQLMRKPKVGSARVKRHNSREVAARTGPADRYPTGIATKRFGIFDYPRERSVRVLNRRWERVLRSEAVVNRDKDTPGPLGELATDRRY